MADPNERQLLAHALSLLAVLLTASGIFVSTVSLESKRPADSERARILHAGRQDIEARLWQDPFSVMRGIAADSPKARCELANKDAEHHYLTLSKLIRRRVHREAVTVLPVMVPGGPYFENGESRRRARYAVVTALLNSGWEPEDEDKLGYVWTFESCTEDPRLRSAPEMLPWEWFSRRLADKPMEGLLVLWVDDDAVSRHPLRGVNAIITKLLPEPRPDSWRSATLKCPPPDGPGGADSGKQPQPWCATRVIGPWTSDGLRGLARELVDSPAATPDHRWLRFYSSGATAATDPRFMTTAIERQRSASTTVSLLAERLDERLLRLTTTDDKLAQALVEELKRRLVDPHPFWRLTHIGNGQAQALCGATIVIAAEGDSIYSRLFAKAFENPRKDPRKDPCGSTPPKVLAKSYLRGLDGVLPEKAGEPVPPVQSRSGSALTNEVSFLKQAPRERAEGRSQYDYLRRLAADLTTLDARERSEGRTGVRAIGVLGNDTYDKILVLQALREGFPKTVFFTADLDARMVDADVIKWTRNLVVASAYGLTLNPGIQGSAPPFRDTYQTGLYLATLVALDPRTQARPTSAFDQSFRSPQLFEIGRTRAVALAPGARVPCGDGDHTSTADPIECPNIHRLEERSGFPWPRATVLVSLFLGAAAFTAMLSCQTFDALAGQRTSAPARRHARHRVSTAAGLGVAAMLLCLFGFGIWHDVKTYKGEPFALLQGVSLWPTVLLRLVVLAVIVGLLWYCVRRPSREIDSLGRAFDLHAPAADAHPWPAFTEQMCLSMRVKRICVISILFFLLGVGLLSLDWPNSPHRGVFSAWSDHVTFLVVLFFLGALLFAFLDTSSMVTRFVRLLAPQMGTSEITELDRRELWNHLRMDERVRWLTAWFRLVVRLGAAVNQLVYLPIIALLLVISTSAGVFDIWTLPPAYLLLFVVAAALAVFYVARLRRRADRLRKSITDELDIWIEQYALEADLVSSCPPPDGGDWKGLPPQAKVRLLKNIRGEVLAERDGPFRPIGEDPFVRAVLLLFGGAGAMITTAKFLLPGG